METTTPTNVASTSYTRQLKSVIPVDRLVDDVFIEQDQMVPYWVICKFVEPVYDVFSGNEFSGMSFNVMMHVNDGPPKESFIRLLGDLYTHRNRREYAYLENDPGVLQYFCAGTGCD